MGTPETRSLFGHSRGGVAVVIDQTPILWCITHGISLVTESANSCVVHKLNLTAGRFAGAECVISTSGPDHKWWENT